jgi:ketosteroid isomerase-like protein
MYILVLKSISNSTTMKIHILYALLAMVFTSCQVPQRTTDHNKKLVLQYFEYFNKHDWVEMAGMYTETAEFKDPSLGYGIVKQSRAQISHKYAELHRIFPDLNDRIINIYPSGEQDIIVEFISTGTAEDRSIFSLPVCTIFHIENDKITKDYTYYDNFKE